MGQASEAAVSAVYSLFFPDFPRLGRTMLLLAEVIEQSRSDHPEHLKNRKIA
jgi:hypothetical protein